MKMRDRIQHAWNAFNSDTQQHQGMGGANFTSYRPNSRRTRLLTRSTIADTVFNRIALDAAMVNIKHVKIASDGGQTPYPSELQKCLSVEANLDQSGFSFMHDLIYSILDEGVAAAVPIETTLNPGEGSFDITNLRVGKVVQWYPEDVVVRVYNEKTGIEEDLTLPKKTVAIIENPLYSIVNGSNSLLNRILSKMELLDTNDEALVNDTMQLILQLPYAVKGSKAREEANTRIKDIEEQLSSNKHGISYVDASEKITQLNRPIASGLQQQIEYLTKQFYNAIGLTENVFNGTANESEMRSYYNRAIDPIMIAILAEFRRKFLTKTARTQGQDFVSYRDPFKLVPVEQLATIADTFSRNAILTSNEIRGFVGFQPRPEPIANELQNKNIAGVNQDTAGASTSLAPSE